jgi:Patatin-like phospholipase
MQREARTRRETRTQGEIRTQGEQPSQPPDAECDLVMKGGITSGVVYPSAVLTLQPHYRFHNIGGASAGAIAASVVAAAEYGRQSGHGGFGALGEVVDELRRPGMVTSLFQPVPAARAAFELLVRGTRTPIRPFRRVLEIGGLAAMRAWWVTLIGVLVAVGVGWAAVTAVRSGGLPAAAAVAIVAAAVVGVAIVLAGAVLLALLLRVLRLRGVLERPGGGFGICPGTRQPGGTGPALTEWLHEKIQHCAGLPVDGPPLTSAQLAEHEIRLNTMTTDLGHARPSRLPLSSPSYLFDPQELEQLFPKKVVESMVASSDRLLAADRELPSRLLADPPGGMCYLPTDELPVLVAARMSLSFPVLISAVPLHVLDEDGTSHRTWMSDGGISSNFPIHFYDAWLPSRPTFGFDFQPYPREKAPAAERQAKAAAEGAGAPEGDADVYMARADAHVQSRPRWVEVRRIGPFLRQIADAMQNWRDTLQADLPGFSERVCHIRLRPTEGGMNLSMPPDVLDGLVNRGRRAGQEVLEHFPAERGSSWQQHVFIRYLMLMEQLQEQLQRTSKSFAAFSPDLAGGLPDVRIYRAAHDAAWCALADTATREFLQSVSGWGPPPGKIEFGGANESMPRPKGALRITPDV